MTVANSAHIANLLTEALNTANDNGEKPRANDGYIKSMSGDLRTATRRVAKALGYANATLRTGDGRQGDYDHAPYDAIVLHCAVPYISPALLDQLAVGARLVAPVGGSSDQRLLLFRSNQQSAEQERALFPVRFIAARSPQPDRL